MPHRRSAPPDGRVDSDGPVRRDRDPRDRGREGRRGQRRRRQRHPLGRARRRTSAPRSRSSKSDPSCHLDWSILAGIGRVESNHGRYGGSQVYADGSTSPHIVGLALNGVGNVASISDTDDGKLDGDTTWDRAVGPMQFIPSTWAVVGTDADGDGVRDPHDIDDAALSAGVYLCAGDRDLGTDAGRPGSDLQLQPLRRRTSHWSLSLANRYATVRASCRTRPGSAPLTPVVPVSNPTHHRPARSPSDAADDRSRRQAEAAEAAQAGQARCRSSKPEADRPDRPRRTRRTRPTHGPDRPRSRPTRTRADPDRPGRARPRHRAARPRTPTAGPSAAPPCPWARRRPAAAQADYDGDGTPESTDDELAGLAGREVDVVRTWSRRNGSTRRHRRSTSTAGGLEGQ